LNGLPVSQAYRGQAYTGKNVDRIVKQPREIDGLTVNTKSLYAAYVRLRGVADDLSGHFQNIEEDWNFDYDLKIRLCDVGSKSSLTGN
jgi:hypothetical protein